MPLVDGGFSLQYSPLLEYREGRGSILFCQLDVTGRTEEDPAAARLVVNLLSYLCDPSASRAAPNREAIYVGDPAGKRHLERAGIAAGSYHGRELTAHQILVVGRGGGPIVEKQKSALARWLKAGGHMLALELDGDEANMFLATAVQTAKREHIAAFFAPPSFGSPFAGIGPADVHNRAPCALPLVSGGAKIVANGALAESEAAHVVYCQLAPYRLVRDPGDGPGLEASEAPRFLAGKMEQQNLRKTYRRWSFLLTRLLANMGVRGKTPLLSRFSTPVSGTAGVSIVKNGDVLLDTDADGMPDRWECTADGKKATCTLEEIDAGTKERCLRLARAGVEEKDKGSLMLAQHDVAVRKGQWYRVSFRSKAEGLGGARVNLALQNTVTWRSLIAYQRFAPRETWKEFTFLVRASATAKSKTRFQIWHDGAGTLWLSDIRMAPCDPPSQGRWTRGFYLDPPQAWDDPYRFFRW